MSSPGFNIQLTDQETETFRKYIQRKMETMLGITLQDRILNRTIRHNTGVRNAVEIILRMNWAGHVARVSDGQKKISMEIKIGNIQKQRTLTRPME